MSAKKPGETWQVQLVGHIIAIPFAMLISVFALPALLLNGWVLTLLWQWFVIPPLGWRPITLLEGTAISLIVHYLAWQPDLGPTEKKSMALLLTMPYYRPLMTLWAAWLVRWIL